VWAGDRRREERDGSGSLTKEFHRLGQTNGASKYFYALNHLGSIVEMLDTSGSIQSEETYDPIGRVGIVSQTIAPDFGYAGYYLHSRSGMNLTETRAYIPAVGRWASRDPIQEIGGINLYVYAGSNPIKNKDPLGLQVGSELPLGGLMPTDCNDPKPEIIPEMTKRLVSQGMFFRAIGAGIDAGIASTVANNSEFTGDQKDAYRHCVWSCMLTVELGAEDAKAITDTYEDIGDDRGQSCASDQMDRANNGHGRDAAKGLWNPYDCINKCRCILKSGGLSGPGGGKLGK
jgi:RHS repeat-associated protein